MKKIILVLILIIFTGKVFASEPGNMPATAALQRLLLGNDRFVRMELKHPNINKDRRELLTAGQHPFAAILSCSDSRVPPEIIFDQGLGDIFVIRNQGNIVDSHVIENIEYAIKNLGINLVIVLGHGLYENGSTEMEEITKTNITTNAEKISNDKKLIDTIKRRGIKMVPAYYDLKTGKVEVLK